MARAQNSKKFAKAQTPSRNALGYAKRRSLKSQTTSGNVSDVYEYQQDKVRRSKVKLQLSKEEQMEFGAGESGSEDEDAALTRAKERRPRLVGEDDDDNNVIDEDDDEEIDSDAAFEESDEERFAGFSFSHKKKGKSARKEQQKKAASARAVRFAEVDLNEDEDEDEDEDVEVPEQATGSDEDEEEEEGDPDEFIDVLDMLDGRGEPQSEDDTAEPEEKASAKSAKSTVPELDDEENEDQSGSEDEDEDEAMEEDSQDAESDVESVASQEESDHVISASDAEDDEENPDALDSLQTFLTGLDAGQKRKAPEDEASTQLDEEKRSKKRKFLKERTEAGAENEFAAHIGGGKLQLDDLLAPLSAQSSNLMSLKQSAKILASSSGAGKKLAAPLPQRTAERLSREAAYEQTKEEVDKWKATMQRIRQAEHLSFPLQAQPAGKTSNLELAAKFKPTTELESAVDRLLKSAKLRDEDITHTESLKMNHLSVEEVAARRAELAKMRELMFRAEAKAKRVAKIKSKTYRRIKKKERQRLAEKLGEDEDDEDDEEARLRRETERAKERATLRHKNTGKWAKAMKGRGELDEDQRMGVLEMLDRGEKLRRKIQGERESGDEDESESEDSDGEDTEAAVGRIKANAFDELAQLSRDDAPDLEGLNKKSKGIFEMKFMKDAMARQQRATNEMVDDFAKELGVAAAEDDDDDEEQTVEEEASNVTVERVGGRVVYRPGAMTVAQSTSLASDTSSVTLKSTDLLPEPRPDSPVVDSPVSQRAVPLPEEEVNPWLAPRTEATSSGKKKHEVTVSKTSASADKSRHKLKKRAQKREEEKEKAKDDATVEISLSNVLTPAAESGPSSKVPKEKGPKENSRITAQPAEGDDSDSDADSEIEEQEKVLDRKGKGRANGVKAFEQRDLVARAFAGDNVIQDFAEQKRREMQEDAPHEIDTTLPGWGAWGGQGTRKAAPKPYLIKKVAGVDPKSRADYKKAHVIISEKRDKKAAKYLVKDLPYPYTSKAQFERNMDTPIGTEWNTRVGFQRATLPRVVTKMGTVISPLEKPLRTS